MFVQYNASIFHKIINKNIYMSQHTPIEQLQNSNEQNKNELVQNILDSYENISENEDNNTANNEQAEHNSRLAEQQFNSDLGYQNQIQEYPEQEMEEYYEDLPEKESNIDKLINNLKSPLIVFVLVFITNFGLLNEVIIKNVPRFVNSNGGMNYLGIAVKALVAAVLYFAVNKFLL